ncbi:chitin deacetylase, partial [Tothia fuscella]
STVNSGADHRCGPSAGNCAADECCSESGYCGKSGDYCHSPECQLDFGPACDGNRGPSTSSTLGVPRSKVNNGIEYGGAGLFKCTVPGVVAITYDDGPSEFTPLILELLDKYESKATFFVNGNGRGRGEIDVKSQWRDIIQRMFNSGHQIASHTYSHQDLDSMNSDHRRNQMIYNEMALANIIHAFPTYMRPPYSRCYSSDCRSLMKELGYHIINFDSDTKDTENVSVEQEMQSFTENLAQGRRLVIGHDIQENTAKKLTEFMLKTIKENGLRAVTVGECLGDPMENWYR